MLISFLNKTRFGFQKAFFQKVHLDKKQGGGSYIRVNMVL